MKKALERVLSAIGAVNGVVVVFEKVALVVLMVAMLVFGFLQVFSRYILKSPIEWSQELLTYSFAWTTFLGASLALFLKKHFSVDILVRAFPPPFRRGVAMLTWALILGFSVFLIVMGTNLTLANRIQMMDVLPLSVSWADLAMPVCGLFIFLHTAQIILEVGMGIDRKEVEEV